MVVTQVLGCAEPAAGPQETEEPPETPVETEAIVWRFHMPWDEERLDGQSMIRWANSVTERSEGRLEVVVYPSGALGHKDADLLRVMGANVIESGIICLSYISRDAPLINALFPQHGARSRQSIEALIPISQSILTDEFAKWYIRLLAPSPMGTCNIILISKKPCDSIEALKDQKIRAWSKEQVETFKTLGLVAEVLPQGDLYMALKTGVFDGAFMAGDAVITQSQYEVTDYFSILCPYNSFGAITCSEAAWQALPSDLQDIVSQCSEDYVQSRLDTLYDCPDEAYFQQMEDLGMIALPPWPEADYDTFLAANRQWWKDALLATGGDAATYYEEILVALDK